MSHFEQEQSASPPPNVFRLNPEKLTTDQIADTLFNFRLSDRYVGVYLDFPCLDAVLLETTDYSQITKSQRSEQVAFFKEKAEIAKKAEQIVFCDYTELIKSRTAQLIEDLKSETFNPDKIVLRPHDPSKREVVRKVSWHLQKQNGKGKRKSKLPSLFVFAGKTIAKIGRF